MSHNKYWLLLILLLQTYQCLNGMRRQKPVEELNEKFLVMGKNDPELQKISSLLEDKVTISTIQGSYYLFAFKNGKRVCYVKKGEKNQLYFCDTAYIAIAEDNLDFKKTNDYNRLIFEITEGNQKWVSENIDTLQGLSITNLRDERGGYIMQLTNHDIPVEEPQVKPGLVTQLKLSGVYIPLQKKLLELAVFYGHYALAEQLGHKDEQENDDKSAIEFEQIKEHITHKKIPDYHNTSQIYTLTNLASTAGFLLCLQQNAGKQYVDTYECWKRYPLYSALLYRYAAKTIRERCFSPSCMVQLPTLFMLFKKIKNTQTNWTQNPDLRKLMHDAIIYGVNRSCFGNDPVPLKETIHFFAHRLNAYPEIKDFCSQYSNRFFMPTIKKEVLKYDMRKQLIKMLTHSRLRCHQEIYEDIVLRWDPSPDFIAYFTSKKHKLPHQ